MIIIHKRNIHFGVKVVYSRNQKIIIALQLTLRKNWDLLSLSVERGQILEKTM
jgi:hypothetical protein